jgi:hypothetical protein
MTCGDDDFARTLCDKAIEHFGKRSDERRIEITDEIDDDWRAICGYHAR